MIQFHISISSIRTVFTKLLSSLIIISLILPDCALCMYEEEMEHITSFSKPAVIVALENDIFLNTTSNQQPSSMLEDEEFNEHLINLSNNPLVGLATDHLDVISGKSIPKTYAKKESGYIAYSFCRSRHFCYWLINFLNW